MSDQKDTAQDAVVTFDGLEPKAKRPEPKDLRPVLSRDRSAHRRHHWLYEDLLN